jgi:hypothetical protein
MAEPTKVTLPGLTMPWSVEAVKGFQEDLDSLATDIANQAEFVAKSHRSDQVSRADVERAADGLMLMRPNFWLKAGSTVSLLVLGGLIGTIIQFYTGDTPVSTDGWMLLIFGVLLFTALGVGCGVASHLRRIG